ncbi:MAG: hypothetical protein H0W97_02595 [Actinobacteria bacterium]|nr:hypothetical protein [Actinomycetota bacterium]
MEPTPTSEPSEANDGSVQQAQTPPPPPPPPPRHRSLGNVWAIVGIVAGFFFLIVPGVLAIRSYRRWRAGSIRRPTLAWTCAWIGVPALALTIYSSWALYNVPVIQDDFSDPSSGWPLNEGLDRSVGYQEGTYRIELRGADSHGASLTWSEGALPNVAVEADVRLRSGDRSTAAAGIGCLEREGLGYVFVIGFDGEFAIGRFDDIGETLVTGHLPPSALPTGSSYTIRAECRAGYGVTRLAMYVNGTKVADTTEPDDGGYRTFTALRLVAVSTAEDMVDVRFDNASVIAIEPS